MIKIKEVLSSDVLLKYASNEEKALILNTQNDRMVESQLDAIDFLKNYKKGEDSFLDSFIFSKRKRNILEIKILSFSFSSSFFKSLFSITEHRYLIILKAFFIISGVVLVPLTFHDINKLNFSLIQFDFRLIINLLVIHFFITCFHEMSHLYYYNKFIECDEIIIGLEIRYFFMLLFFSKTSFISILPKKSQFKIIFGGIEIQLILNGLFLLVSTVFHFKYLILISLVNLFSIVLNVLPFLKTDGYWLINLALNTDDYMKSFRDWIFRKEKELPLSVIILSIFNLCIILLIIFQSILQIGNYFSLWE